MEKALLALIVLAFLAVQTGAVIYLSRRLSAYFGLRRRMALILVSLATLFGYAGIMVFTNAYSALSTILYAFAGILLGFLLYLGMGVVLADLLRWLTGIRKKVLGFAVLVLVLMLSGYAVWNTFHVRLHTEEVSLEGLTSKIRIMQWSDVHLGHLRGRDFLEQLVYMTLQEEADLVVITGDLFDGRVRMRAGCLAPLEELGIPVFYVEGNHDVYSGSKHSKELVDAAGVRVLNNEVVRYRELQILGMDYMLADDEAFDTHPGIPKQTLKAMLPRIRQDESLPLLLLHHAPYGISYAVEEGVDLYLAGHTHGGQLFPMTWVNRLLFAYNKGMYEHRGMKIYVSEGAGSAAIPMRLGTHSSITLLRLLPASSKKSKSE